MLFRSILTPPTASTTATLTSSVGTYPITLAGGLNGNYSFTLVDGTLTVTQATIVATADNKTRVYGDPNPAFTITYTGFRNGETSAVIDLLATATSSAVATTGVGTYPIVPSGGSDNNYVITYANGTLTITQATLTVTADNQTRAYGDVNPTLTVSYSGFKNSETSAVLTTLPTATTVAINTSIVGTYPIVPSGGVSGNYAFTYVNGTLTVTKAVLTATANNQTKVYGDANPALTIAYTGFKNGETAEIGRAHV